MAYRFPTRNPLRRLPVRQYQGPFGNPLPGLGVIDIGTSATVDVTPTTTTITPTGGQPVTVGTPQPSISDYLNANSSTLLWVAGIGLGVLFLARLTK